MINISYTRLRTWRDCQQAHYYRYVEKLSPKQVSIKLTRGSLIHKMLELTVTDESKALIYFYDFLDKIRVIDPVEADSLYSCKDIVDRYFKIWKEEPLTYVKLEVPISSILTKKTMFVGYVDAIVKDSSGKLWILERKTSESMPDSKDRLMTSQALLYVHFLRLLGYKIEGIIWDYIRTKAPTKPELLKNGSLTKRANIDTIQEVYLSTIQQYNLNPADYRDILKTLEGKELDFYRRHRQRINEDTLENVLIDAKRDAIRITKQQHRPTRNLSWQCKNCVFFGPCSLELQGLDASLEIEQRFTKGESKS